MQGTCLRFFDLGPSFYCMQCRQLYKKDDKKLPLFLYKKNEDINNKIETLCSPQECV